MAKKKSPDEKQYSKLVQQLATLVREQTVLEEKNRMNGQYQNAIRKEIDNVTKIMLQGVNSELTYEERQLAPTNKIMVIKMVRERCNNGLLEAKNMVDAYLATKHIF